MKKLIRFTPELYFIAIGIYWAQENFFASGHINYYALLTCWLMFLQLIYKNRYLGLIYGNILGIASLYMIGAVLSEYRDFSNPFEAEGLLLLAVYGFVFGIGILMGGGMIYRSLKAKQAYDESVLTITY